MEERSRRIVQAAIQLAEEGGFEAVRLRDVAAQADVALGTLYRRFRSKEALLVAVLELQVGDMERRMVAFPPPGETALERVIAFFEGATRRLLGRPHLARAVVRSMTSGVPELSLEVAAFNTRMHDMIVASLRGGAAGEAAPGETERRLGYTLLLVWFASLTGWAAGIHGEEAVVDHTRTAAELLLRPAARENPAA